jgi:hypothetical protein
MSDGEGGFKCRLLRPGERIAAGDRPLLDDCETWGQLSRWEIGMAYNPVALVPIRRAHSRLSPEQLAYAQDP